MLCFYYYVRCARKIEILSIKILEEPEEKKKGNYLGHDQQLEERTAARESTDSSVTSVQLLRLNAQELILIHTTNIKFFQILLIHKTKILKISIRVCFSVPASESDHASQYSLLCYPPAEQKAIAWKTVSTSKATQNCTEWTNPRPGW